MFNIFEGFGFSTYIPREYTLLLKFIKTLQI
jgi:hypothetical protein